MYTTPIQKMNFTCNNNNFFMKRDDLLPISFGGNKVRKAILFFEDIEGIGSDCVVTYGSSSSNHCRIIANISASKDLPCHIISPSESNHQTANSKLIELFGAQITHCSVSEVSSTIDSKLSDLRSNGYNPYLIEGGGHGDLGTQAYVNVFKEIMEYERATNIHFDYIFHTSGTGTTQAGLVCGNLLQGNDKTIVGISNARKNPYGGKVVLDSVHSYLTNIKKETINAEQYINFVDDYILDGYGSYNIEVIKTIKRVLKDDGIPLDTTYTGKAFWGMQEYIKKNQIAKQNILFIHTGGTPLFFDNLEELTNER